MFLVCCLWDPGTAEKGMRIQTSAEPLAAKCLRGTVAASSDRTITTCLIIRWCAKEAWVRREWPERGSMPEVVPGRPDGFSKQ